MMLYIVVLVSALTTTSLVNTGVVDAAESNLYRGARGSAGREGESRRLQMMDGKGTTPGPAPAPVPAPVPAPTPGKGSGKGSGKGGMALKGRQDALNEFFTEGPPCPECKQELPGYSFFGDLYFEDDFYGVSYADAVFASRAGKTVVPLGPFGGIAPDFGIPIFGSTCIRDPRPECQLVNPFPNVDGIPLPDTIPDDCSLDLTDSPTPSPTIPTTLAPATPTQDLDTFEDTFNLCKFVAGISEVIYSLDSTRCLLLSIQKVAREIICYVLDLFPTLNPDETSGRKLSDAQTRRLERVHAVRKLNEQNNMGDTVLPMDGIMMLFEVLGIDDLLKLTNLMNITSIMPQFVGPLPSTRRALAPAPIRSDDGAEFISDVNDALNSFFNANTEQVIESNFFFDKCTRIFPLPFAVCAAIFALFKTTDASICYYQDELSCTIDEDCTKDLAFTTEYNKRRAAIYLPSIFGFITGSGFVELIDPTNFILGDILAPCSTCASFKNECAPYCNFVDGFESCDVAKRIYLTALDFFI